MNCLAERAEEKKKKKNTPQNHNEIWKKHKKKKYTACLHFGFPSSFAKVTMTCSEQNQTTQKQRSCEKAGRVTLKSWITSRECNEGANQ